MNKTKRLIGMIGCVLYGAVSGYTTLGQPSVSVGVSVPLPAVEIRGDSDFYEPLTPLGEWVVIGSYGRCWRPARVEAGWRPYCNGKWQRTDAGWYWVTLSGNAKNGAEKSLVTDVSGVKSVINNMTIEAAVSQNHSQPRPPVSLRIVSK